MKNLLKVSTVLGVILGLCVLIQSFSLPDPKPVPAPAGTVVQLTNADALDGAGYWAGNPLAWHWNTGRQAKITFFGSRYSDGQDVTDPNCPIVETNYSETNNSNLANYYYRNGYVQIWSRESSSDPWIFQGEMQMSSSNCTMDGSKVTLFIVNVNYLYNP